MIAVFFFFIYLIFKYKTHFAENWEKLLFPSPDWKKKIEREREESHFGSRKRKERGKGRKKLELT